MPNRFQTNELSLQELQERIEQHCTCCDLGLDNVCLGRRSALKLQGFNQPHLMRIVSPTDRRATVA